eukprot:1320457-Amorphochlora_amoeboformis.AAC.1
MADFFRILIVSSLGLSWGHSSIYTPKTEIWSNQINNLSLFFNYSARGVEGSEYSCDREVFCLGFSRFLFPGRD